MDKLLECPACRRNGTSKTGKLKLCFTGRSVNCINCEQSLRTGGRIFALFIGVFAGSMGFYIGLYSLIIESWLPVFVLFICVYIFMAIPQYFFRFKFSGTKQFRI